MANQMSQAQYVKARSEGASATEAAPVKPAWQGSSSEVSGPHTVDTRSPLPSSQPEEKKEDTGFAKGGEVKLNFSQFKKVGGDKHTTILKHKDGHEIRIAHNALKPNEKKQVMALKHYAEGGEVDSDQSGGASETWDTAPTQDVPQNIQLPAQQEMQLPPQASAAPIQQAAQEQEQGIKQQATAEGQLGQKEASLAGQQADAATQLAKSYQDNVQQLTQERQSIMNDIAAKHIDPSRYMKNLSTGAQVGTAIGLILGGIGGGGTHNLVMDALQKNIDRDVEAQKAEVGQKENLLHATMQQFGNLHDAVNMTKVITTDAYINKIQQAAAQSKDPMAQARAQQAIGQLHMQVAPLLQQIAQRQTILQGVHGNIIPPEMAVEALVPKEHQKDVFNEIGKAQNAQQNEKFIMDNFDKANKQNTVLKTGAGMLRTPDSIISMQNMLLPLIKDNEGRVNEFEFETTKQMMPQPGDSEQKVSAKRAALQHFIEQKKAAPTAKGYGLDLSRLQSTKPAPAARPNPNQTYGK